MIAITTLLLVVAISLVITRVATVILTATGMSAHSARFQARSAFTGAGFTTSESERVVDHPLRRKVIMALMLLGNAGIVAAASSTILGFRGGGLGQQWWRILELVIGLISLVVISRSRWVDRRLTRAIERVVSRHSDLQTRDLGALLDLSGPYAVNELAVKDGEWLAGRLLAELELREEGVIVLGLNRRDGRYVGAPTGATQIQPGDILIVYGRGDRLRELDDRLAGADGDRAHELAVRRHMTEQQEQDAADHSARVDDSTSAANRVGTRA